MADEPIGKGRRAIFGGPKPSEVKPQGLKDNGDDDKALSLNVETVKPMISPSEETKLKDDSLKPEALGIKDDSLSLKDKATEPITHLPEVEGLKPESLKLKAKSSSHKAKTKRPPANQVEEIKPKAESLKHDDLKLKDQGQSIKAQTFNSEILLQVISDSKSSRKTIAVWSPVISAALWYLKATTPMYSISDAARAWVEAGLERDHPELIKRIKEEMKKSG